MPTATTPEAVTFKVPVEVTTPVPPEVRAWAVDELVEIVKEPFPPDAQPGLAVESKEMATKLRRAADFFTRSVL